MGLFNKSPKKKLNDDSSKFGVNLVAELYPTSSVSEQFRTVMTNISFANINGDLKSIMVTSSDPSEGKSTFSANLAVTYAKQGRNVVLVDADMRRPTVHKSFNVSNQKGLSTILSGNSTIEDTIKYTSIDNLNVITSGPIPPNASALLGNRKIVDIINKFNKPNDLVIVDVPPVNTMTDASIVSTTVDGTIFVLPQGVAEKKRAKMAVEQLKKVNANILGGVMNMSKDNITNDYYYYYSK
ncbi:putative tyrosine-protein kinase capB [Apilactobacillus kunkeei]|uniref:CpsD/CapB family tyrosine-protein kinase n=1 Tax=Apilactobacillus kunkeei TaxID=148814 RepID=UPI0006B2526D|nr:CpsD/CapB family tyrosine-protein kinase [Apilactobacillus kunkeei]KOY77459.1 putative tyrosine-protein kinase capB [Apilactobacillus kunkeei]